MSILTNRTFLVESKYWFMKPNSRFYRSSKENIDLRYTRCGIYFDKNSMEDGDWIFVKTELLPVFIRRYVPTIDKKFVLITGLSDYCIPSFMNKYECNVTPLLDSPYMIAWFCTNYTGGYPEDKVYPLAYGIEAAKYDSKELKQNIIENKKRLMFSSFRLRNDNRRLHIAKQMGNTICNYNSYTSLLNQSKYSICPMGCAPDTFRLWESIFFNSIPVLEYPSYLQRELLDKHGIQYISIGKTIDIEEAGIKIVHEQQDNEHTWESIDLDIFPYTYPNHSEKATAEYWIQYIKTIQQQHSS